MGLTRYVEFWQKTFGRLLLEPRTEKVFTFSPSPSASMCDFATACGTDRRLRRHMSEI